MMDGTGLVLSVHHDSANQGFELQKWMLEKRSARYSGNVSVLADDQTVVAN